MPLPSTCPQCGAPAASFAGVCANCNRPFLVPNLATAAAVDPDGLRKYMAAYEARLPADPSEGRTWFALGLCTLYMHSFDRAIHSLERASQCAADEPDPYYYVALARIGGRALATIPTGEIEQIVEDLETASRLQPGDPRYLVAAAAVRADHFEANRLAVPHPTVEELLREAEHLEADREEMRRLRELLLIRDPRVRSLVRRLCGDNTAPQPPNPHRTESRSARIRNWFDIRKPAFPWPGLGLAVLLGLMAWAILAGGRPVHSKRFAQAALAVGVGCMLYYLWQRYRYGTRPSAEQMMQWFKEDFAAVQARSTAATGLDVSTLKREPIAIPGLLGAGAGLADSHRNRSVADDGEPPLIHACWDCLVLLFGQDRLVLYRCYYNWYRNLIVNERIEEYHYHHIVAVKTLADSAPAAADGQVIERSRRFVVSFASGEKVRLQVAGHDVRSFNEAEMVTLAEHAVQSIRATIRAAGPIEPRA